MVCVQATLAFSMMRVCVVIPTYNESGAIGELVEQVFAHNFFVVVVDDGSKDNTVGIARDKGAVVLESKINQGKGASLIKGFEYVLSNNFDAAITMDGDGQHLAEDLSYFIRLAEYSESAIIIGNRMANPKNMPLLRVLTNKFMSWMISGITKQDIPDTQCGFRLIKKEVLEKADFKCRKYEIESEILIKASRLGFKIESVPIKTVYGFQKSRINPFKDTLRFIRFILKEGFKK